ncbi:hypothetical protein L484_023883 [Morus notabilis]|uniref:Uncharacterized protein n=1 Tax=Morus notabilis TaxID=981085 RepID=W9R578_9ROSA|nr:hypothetical protein L484_023883 [Morus notabilis]
MLVYRIRENTNALYSFRSFWMKHIVNEITIPGSSPRKKQICHSPIIQREKRAVIITWIEGCSGRAILAPRNPLMRPVGYSIPITNEIERSGLHQRTTAHNTFSKLESLSFEFQHPKRKRRDSISPLTL